VRFGFRITRHVWLSLPWWLFPIVLVVLVAELAVLIIVAAFTLVAAAIATATAAPRRRGS
jgi:hypothetical protein